MLKWLISIIVFILIIYHIGSYLYIRNVYCKLCQLKKALDDSIIKLLKDAKIKTHYQRVDVTEQNHIFYSHVKKIPSALYSLIDDYNNQALKYNALVEFFPFTLTCLLARFTKAQYFVKK